MANLGLIDFKIGLYIKVNVTAGQNKFEVHIYQFGERSHMTSARFWQILPPPSPLSATVSIERPPPLMTSAFARPPPPFQSDISFSKNPLHSTLIETLNVYLIQLKNEHLGEYINAVVSRIVIGQLDLKQFLPKFKYFCGRQQGLDPPPPLVSNRHHFETPFPPRLLTSYVNAPLPKMAVNWHKIG